MNLDRSPPSDPSAAEPVPARVAPARRAEALRRWVPIRSLGPSDRGAIAQHLLDLAEPDRYLRFGQALSDEQILHYVEGIDFSRDELFGIVNRRLQLIATAHLAYAPRTERQGRTTMAEFGVSVLPQVRGRGYGERLFDHAVMHARNRGIATLYIHALSENGAMLHIARKAGATLEREGSESEAWLRLPPDTLATQFEELVETHAAEFDYLIKQQVQRVGDLIEVVGEVREQLLRQGGGSARQ